MERDGEKETNIRRNYEKEWINLNLDLSDKMYSKNGSKERYYLLSCYFLTLGIFIKQSIFN